MYSGLEYGKRIVVGLIIIFALLFFCGYEGLQVRIAEEIARIEALQMDEDAAKDNIESKRIVDPNKPMIALTFDDGPGKYTMQLLDTLEKYDARASFFMLGICVEKYPDEVRRMKEMGCDIGNHTTNHARLTNLDVPGIVNELHETNSRLEKIIGQGATFMRPPYGSINELVAGNSNMPIVMWSVDTRDWENKNVDLVVDHVLQTIKDGDIVLLHDIHETTIRATAELIPKLIEQGYQLVTVSEMAQARGVQLQNGAIYGNLYKE